MNTTAAAESSTAPSSLSSTKDLIAMIRDVTVILAVYLYYSGYFYLHTFYQVFGIDANALDLSLDYVLVFGSHTFRQHPLELLVCAEIIVALVLAVRLARIEAARRASHVTADATQTQRVPGLPAEVVFRAVQTAVLIGASLALLDLTGEWAKSDARIAAGKYFASDDYGQRVMLVEKDATTNSFSPDLTAANARHHLWFVAEGKDWLFLMGARCTVTPDECAFARNVCPSCARYREVFRVAKDDVNATIIAEDPRPTPTPTPTPFVRPTS